MAYKPFDNKKTWTSGEEVPAATLNAWADGEQDEFEERMEALSRKYKISRQRIYLIVSQTERQSAAVSTPLP